MFIFFTRHRLYVSLYLNTRINIHTAIMLIIDIQFVLSSFMGNPVRMYVKLNIFKHLETQMAQIGQYRKHRWHIQDNTENIDGTDRTIQKTQMAQIEQYKKNRWHRQDKTEKCLSQVNDLSVLQEHIQNISLRNIFNY